MRIVLRLAGIAHAVALDRLGEDDRRLAFVVYRRVVGRIYLERIVPAAVQPHDVVVGKILDEGLQLGRLPEEVLPGVRATLGLVVLVLAVDHLVHAPLQRPADIVGKQRIPQPAPDHLDDVPAGAAEHAFELLDDLAVAPHRSVEPLQVAVHHEDQVVELLSSGEAQAAEGLGLVALAVAQERPDLAIAHRYQAAAVQVLHDVGLVDGLDRAQAHRHGGELPVVRHQPRMRVGRKTAVHLPAEGVEIGFGEAALQVRPRVDAWCAVALEVDEVAGLVCRRASEEVVEADVVQSGGRGERRDVPAQVAAAPIGAHDHRQRVPADERADAPLHEQVARHERFPVRRDGVAVGRRDRIGQRRAGFGQTRGKAFEQEVRPLDAVALKDVLQRFQPLAGLRRVRIGAVDRVSRPRPATGVRARLLLDRIHERQAPAIQGSVARSIRLGVASSRRRRLEANGASATCAPVACGSGDSRPPSSYQSRQAPRTPLASPCFAATMAVRPS